MIMNFPTKEKHEEFVKCLEEFGSQVDGNEWSSIASKMNWSTEDVKLYAFWYMEQLQADVQQRHGGYTEENEENGTDGVTAGTDNNLVKCNHVHDSMDYDEEDCELWSYGERALFDTLIITYDVKTASRWEKIASLIPEKDHNQCRRRWESYQKNKKL